MEKGMDKMDDEKKTEEKTTTEEEQGVEPERRKKDAGHAERMEANSEHHGFDALRRNRLQRRCSPMPGLTSRTGRGAPTV